MENGDFGKMTMIVTWELLIHLDQVDYGLPSIRQFQKAFVT
jgi:hypothetical protein